MIGLGKKKLLAQRREQWVPEVIMGFHVLPWYRGGDSPVERPQGDWYIYRSREILGEPKWGTAELYYPVRTSEHSLEIDLAVLSLEMRSESAPVGWEYTAELILPVQKYTEVEGRTKDEFFDTQISRALRALFIDRSKEIKIVFERLQDLLIKPTGTVLHKDVQIEGEFHEVMEFLLPQDMWRRLRDVERAPVEVPSPDFE